MARSKLCIQFFMCLYCDHTQQEGATDPIVTASKEEEYEVESILKHCWWGQVMEYLVHWHGYNETEDSWVSEQDLIHALQILQ